MPWNYRDCGSRSSRDPLIPIVRGPGVELAWTRGASGGRGRNAGTSSARIASVLATLRGVFPLPVIRVSPMSGSVQAALRSPSIRRSQEPIRFQLALVWSTK